jgi:ABC-type nitrate/sulfonate/bicarbonate transport system substrate-binding protein
VALDAVLTGSSDIGSTGEIGGLARWDKGGKLYVTSYRVTSRQQMGLAARQEIKQPEDLLGKIVGFLRASGGHYYFGRYVKKSNLTCSSVLPHNPPPSVHLRGAQLPSKNRRGFSTVSWWMSWSEAPSPLRWGSTRREMNV